MNLGTTDFVVIMRRFFPYGIIIGAKIKDSPTMVKIGQNDTALLDSRITTLAQETCRLQSVISLGNVKPQTLLAYIGKPFEESIVKIGMDAYIKERPPKAPTAEPVPEPIPKPAPKPKKIKPKMPAIPLPASPKLSAADRSLIDKRNAKIATIAGFNTYFRNTPEDEHIIRVHLGYNFADQIGKRDPKIFSSFNNQINDANFSDVSARLKPGARYIIRFHWTNLFMAYEQAVQYFEKFSQLTGPQGLIFLREHVPGIFPSPEKAPHVFTLERRERLFQERGLKKVPVFFRETSKSNSLRLIRCEERMIAPNTSILSFELIE